MLQKQWSKTKCQCNCMHKLKQNIPFFFYLFEKMPKTIDYYELYEDEYDYCILDMSIKGRQEKCQKTGIKAVTDSHSQTHWQWVQKHLFSSNLNWMLDFGVRDENNSLISLTVLGCSLLWQWNMISLTLTGGNGIGFRWIRIGVNEVITAF